MNRQLKRN